MEQAQRNKYIEWQTNTISAADYTVSFKITDMMFDNFLNQYYDERNPLSMMAQCRIYFKNEFEYRLN